MLFTPQREIYSRIERIKSLIEKASLDGAFFNYKIDYYYLSGTMQDAFLLVRPDRDPILFVRRELGRARRESPLAEVLPIKSFSEVRPYAQGMRRIGFQLDVAPYNFVMKFKEILGDVEFVNVSPLVMTLRKIKSAFELRLMERAVEIARQVYQQVPELLTEGMREIELGGALEAYAKKLGHEGLLRTRSMNYEAYTWHILSGKTGAVVSQSDSPMGGLGLSPAFPVGASMKRMRKGEPILVDFGVCCHGYQVDQTRMYAIGYMPEEFVRAYEVCKEIHYRVLDKVLAGAKSSDLFDYSTQLALDAGYGDYFLGYDHHKVSFLAHGIGLELSELPFIARNHDYVLEPGMTFAIEPKMVFPRKGACGLENTVVLEDDSYRILTDIDEQITIV